MLVKRTMNKGVLSLIPRALVSSCCRRSLFSSLASRSFAVARRSAGASTGARRFPPPCQSISSFSSTASESQTFPPVEDPQPMFFRQLFDANSFTFTYVLACKQTREALVIDTVDETLPRDKTFLQQWGLDVRFIAETHIHADHITAAVPLRQDMFPNAKIVLSAAVGPREHTTEDDVVVECPPEAAMFVKDYETFHVGQHRVVAIHTPGHTTSCCSYYVPSMNLVFTGDALLIRGCGRTDFQGGSSTELYHSVRDKLFAGLPGGTLVYPAHDYAGHHCSSVMEERLFNPRLRDGVPIEEFEQIMTDLKLAPPKRIAQALPANLRCGAVQGVEMHCAGHPEKESL